MNEVITIEDKKENEKENNMSETKLPKVNHETNEQTITSLEVAEMVGKNHKDLMRDVRRYVEQLGQSKIAPSDFFKESTYKNSQNKTQPCYKVTKKGCEFIAHKLTGIKGTEFTAKYINRFHEMEDYIIREEKSVQAFSKRLYQTSSTPIPRNPSFYERNRRRMERLCKHENVPLSTLYHHILKRVGEEYNLQEAERIYEEERGTKPEYPMDMVNYFSDLSNLAEIYLDKLEKFTFG